MKARLTIALGILISFLAGIFWAFKASELELFREGLGGSATYNLLFDTATPLIVVSIFVGVLFGAKNAEHEKERIVNGKVKRHDESMFLMHWSHALGCLLLILTGLGLGTLFIPRFVSGIDKVALFMNLHFIGILFFLFGTFFYITRGILNGEIKTMYPKRPDITDAINHFKAMILKTEMPKEGKFLSVEKVVFPAWTLAVGGIVITGLIKVSAHIWDLPGGLMEVTTFCHGLSTVLIAFVLLSHIFGSSIVPASWPLFRSMFTGYVTEAYVKSHHEKWYEEILENGSSSEEVEQHEIEFHMEDSNHKFEG